MSNIICSICLAQFNVNNEKIHSTNCGHIFHLSCLNESLKVQNNECPSCRRRNIQHFQLYFDNEDDFGGSSSIGCTRGQLEGINKKLDHLSLCVQALGGAAAAIPSDQTDLMAQIEKLQQENADLKEIHEMEEIVIASSEKEITDLKEEIRQRNDIINSMQLENDNLRDELRLLNARAIGTEKNLIDI